MWAVVIYNKFHKHIERFHSIKGKYGAFRYKLLMMRRFSHRPDIKIEIVSALKAFPPDESQKKHKGEWWCPYCKKYRKFKVNGYLGVKECPVCTMSDRDYYIKKYNNLWNKGSIGRSKKKE